MDDTTLFWQLAEALYAEDGRVSEGTMMGGRCLRVGGEFLALAGFKEGGLVLKLPKARVAQVIAEGVGEPFAPAGKVFKEWVRVPVPDEDVWLGLLREGIEFAVK